MFKAPKKIIIALTLSLLATACVREPTEPKLALPLPPSKGDTFNVQEAEAVLTNGFDTISDRYIKDVNMRDVAMEGMRGLSAIDPAIHVSLKRNRVLFSHGDTLIGTLSAPRNNAVEAWAQVTVGMTMLGRRLSPAMRKASEEDVYKAVFDAALASLDVFSRYSSAEEARENRASRNGFGGIGIRYRMDGGEMEILEIFKDGPAASADLRIGDRITHVDDVLLQGLSEADVRRRIRGPIDTKLTLTVQRRNIVSNVHLIRDLVVPNTVAWRLEGPDAIIQILSFNQQTAASVAEALTKARAQLGTDLQGVVLDMRGNPGGLLDQAVSVSDLFLPSGGIVSTRGRHPDSSQRYSAAEGDIGEQVPLAVLMDGRSASAAEIVGAALQDNGRAVVVGTTSFGKGSVQTVVRLPNDGELTLTWSRFHSPTGYALHGLGVLPIVCTSGETAGLIRRLREGTVPAAVNLSIWRASDINDKKQRAALRRSCRPETHQGARQDVNLALKILKNNTLLARAIALSTPTAAQR